jgi:uncharacterized protein (UPF0335 family)
VKRAYCRGLCACCLCYNTVYMFVYHRHSIQKARLKALTKQLEDSKDMRKQLLEQISDLQKQLKSERDDNKMMKKRLVRVTSCPTMYFLYVTPRHPLSLHMYCAELICLRLISVAVTLLAAAGAKRVSKIHSPKYRNYKRK